MPVKSKAQMSLMQAAAHDTEISKKTGISASTAKEFINKTPKNRFKKLKERVGGK